MILQIDDTADEIYFPIRIMAMRMDALRLVAI